MPFFFMTFFFYSDKKVNVIHCSTPISKDNKEAAETQDKMFMNIAYDIVNTYTYDIIIMNRAWYGEYVYGCLYRERTDDEVKQMINDIEYFFDDKNTDACYIQLLCDSTKLLMKNDDGNSISKGNENKINLERERFLDIFETSMLKKKLIKVNDNDEFRDKEEIFKGVLEFVNE